MRRAVAVAQAGLWPIEGAVGTVTLAADERHRRRVRLTTDGGEQILLDLPRAEMLAHGDGLRLEGGGWLRVRAAEEDLVEVRTAEGADLLRLAWHLGNRHLPTEIRDGCLRIRRDHVIEDMLRGLGADLHPVRAPFQPEGGAYGGHGHAH